MKTGKLLDYIPIFILFVSIALSFCAFPIVINNNLITFALIFQMAFCGVLLLLNHNKLFSQVKKFFSYKEVKMIVLYLIAVIVLGFVVMLRGGNAGIVKVILTSFFRVIRIIFPLFFGYYIVRKLKNHKIISLLILILLVIFCYGFVDLLIFSLNITVLKPIFHFFINAHVPYELLKTDFRIQSFFGEPSYLGFFIVVFLPILYCLFLYKIKVFNNPILNRLVRKIMLPFAFLMLLLTQSPIFIVFGFLTLGLLCISRIKNKKMLLYLIFLFIIFSALFSLNFNSFVVSFMSNKVGERIVNTIMSFSDIDMLINAEASLATRIISYLNMLDIFKQNPILGCGCGNLQNAVYNNFLSLNYPLTPEIISSLKSDKVVINGNIFFQTIAESGIFSVIFLYSSFLYIIKRINNTLRFAKSSDFQILQSFRMYMYVFIVLSFYDSNIYLPYIWVMFGIIIGYCVNIQKAYVKLR